MVDRLSGASHRPMIPSRDLQHYVPDVMCPTPDDEKDAQALPGVMVKTIPHFPKGLNSFQSVSSVE